MANVKKFGEAVVITSAAKLEDIEKIAKYAPDALILYSEGEEKEPVFAVGVTPKRAGNFSQAGIEFGGADGQGYAQVTLGYAGPVGTDDEVKAAIADSMGAAVVMLTKLEATFPAVLAKIDADIAEILSSIEIA